MEQHYEYEFEQVKTTVGFLGRRSYEYQDVIRRRAAEGWRFVQAYAPSIGGQGIAYNVDLVFERPAI